jgi:hypothetical protein
MTIKQHINEFDFLGLALLMAGTVCVLIGLKSGETSCVSDRRTKISCIDDRLAGSTAETIALLSVGCTLLIIASINEILTHRSPIIPPRLFKVGHSYYANVYPIAEYLQTRTTGIILVTCFFHALTFFSGTLYAHPEPSWLPIGTLMTSQALSTSRYIIKSLDRLQLAPGLGEDDIRQLYMQLRVP